MILGTVATIWRRNRLPGNPVDKRADIWAFGGAVQMLTGKRLFEGETSAHTFANVMAKGVRPNAIAPTLRPLLRRCLKRDPCERLRDIGDAATERMSLRTGPDSNPRLEAAFDRNFPSGRVRNCGDA